MQGSTPRGKRSLPACRSQPALGATKRVTAPGSPRWGGLTAHTPLPLGDFHLPTFRAGSRDEKAAPLSLEGYRKKWGRRWLHLPAPAVSGPWLSIIRSHRSGRLLQLLGPTEPLPLQGKYPTCFEGLPCLLNSLLFGPSCLLPLVSGKKKRNTTEGDINKSMSLLFIKFYLFSNKSMLCML